MKNYLIVGASSGIGRSLVNLLKSDGNHVYGTYFTNNEFKYDV
jgi:NAD(P)-dependent dehydrogenase (short-subunit alcohol dehydrogenase family)